MLPLARRPGLALPNALLSPLCNSRPRRTFIALAIETSCDDTAVSILDYNGRRSSAGVGTYPRAEILFNEKITANNLAHGGIHPLVALESHQENLSALITKALQHLPIDHTLTDLRTTRRQAITLIPDDSQLRRKPSLICVTRGPGMRSSLTTGLDTAKGLAVAWQIPLIGIHHMQAHALTPRLVSALQQEIHSNGPLAEVAEKLPPLQPEFPFLSLLVSGGHTLLVHSTSVTEHRILASTVDVAIGDCLDKVARDVLPQEVLSSSADVSYGPLLEQFAFPRQPGDSSADYDYKYDPPATRRELVKNSEKRGPYGWPFPTPLIKTRGGQKANSMEFSFTGVVTYAHRISRNGWKGDKLGQTQRDSPMSEEEARYLAREAMRAAFEHMASRVILHLQKEKDDNEGSLSPLLSKTLVISGGVAANHFLRHILREYLNARGFADVAIFAPPMELCTDNAAMIAWAGCEMMDVGQQTSALNIRALRKWSLENLLQPEKEKEATKPLQDLTLVHKVPSSEVRIELEHEDGIAEQKIFEKTGIRKESSAQHDETTEPPSLKESVELDSQTAATISLLVEKKNSAKRKKEQRVEKVDDWTISSMQ